MNILFVASEAVPFAKTGGLADVCSALPIALSEQGHHVSVIMPAYSGIENAGVPIETTGKTLSIPIGDRIVYGELLKSHFPNTNVPVYFVRHDLYYHRDGLYNSRGVDYQDNCERFVFFSRSVLETIRLLNLEVDILHANDWQTGLVPAYLQTIYKSSSKFQDLNDPFAGFGMLDDHHDTNHSTDAPLFDRIRSVFTIHNLRHQGRFWQWDMNLTGLDWKYFTYDKMEFYDQLNLLKTGITFSDALTTVSPRYAEEIQTEGFGERLQGVLRYRREVLHGILNGINTREWDPATDADLSDPYVCYDRNTVFENKPKCKRALQQEWGLPERPEVPLLGIVSRFDPQKGLDLITQLAGIWVQRFGAQFVVLGTGDSWLEGRFHELASWYPENIAVRLAFSPKMSHRVEAGSDMFLMPSRYEPCGLNQMYSQRYGTLPLVRLTGGLADTVINGSDDNIERGIANGFCFHAATTDDLNKAFEWAIHCFYDRKDDWKKMMLTAMSQDWSWSRSAKKYADLYQDLLQK